MMHFIDIKMNISLLSHFRDKLTLKFKRVLSTTPSDIYEALNNS